MSSKKQHSEQNMQDDSTADFHGAAIIDSDGNELPITDEMVKRACEKLEEERSKNSL